MDASVESLAFEKSPARSLGRPQKHVLLLVTDLYAHFGGGQTAYRAIILNAPDTHFYYFTREEKDGVERPINASPVRFKEYYYANVGDLPAEMGHFYPDYLTCWQFARSFAERFPGVDLDVVDTPDYQTAGLFIRAALEMHGVRVGVVSLALHGTISSALTDEWGHRHASRGLAELRLRERMQYQAVDGRYALSAAYADERARKSGGHGANLIDPLIIVGPFAPQFAESDDLPSIAFIGRRERRKGPDLFIDALWSLDRDKYARSLIIGPDSSGSSGVNSKHVLETMARSRSLDVEFLAPMPREALDQFFLEPVIVLLPSRYDQFNLVALEALRLGAPVFVSKEAGVARWITEMLPELSDLTFDISGAREASRKLIGALEDYKGLRERIVDALTRRDLRPDLSTLATMYEPALRAASSAKHALSDIRHRLDSFNRPRERSVTASLIETVGPSGLPRWKQAIIASPLRPVANFIHLKRLELQGLSTGASGADPTAPVTTEMLEAAVADRSPRALSQLAAAENLESVRHSLLHTGERSRAEIASKLKLISKTTETILVSRAALFRDMARLERKRPGGDLVAATYCLRIMRWMGEDRFGDIEFVASTFDAHGFHKEAQAARAIYASPSTANIAIGKLLRDQLASQKSKSLGEFAIRDDRRGDFRPRVSVIVSLYNAESKLNMFLSQLSAQSLVHRDELEIILVDSGSPTEEYAAFKDFMKNHSLPILYVRTERRETIQAAWNRGIQLSRGRYLSFLGVDEGVHPDAYEILSKALDSQPDIDWVMADSIVTDVDRAGGFVSDVMTYDRRGYEQNLVYLETCYLSWVGGLYRRKIHDEIGFYDETFRGAGDTEFKSRILPFVKSAHVPQTLGLFLNYPEERTTQHPRAEIEDLRAWYIFRSTAGVAYVWDEKPISEVEEFFRFCLSYRKSYCGHLSTDFDMAQSVAKYMVERGDNPKFADAAIAAASHMIELIRGLETLDLRLSPAERRRVVLDSLVSAKGQEAIDQERFGLRNRPRYEIVNDNRYEQHWYSWST